MVQGDKTHHDESEDREDVVGGVSEERPPCQGDGLGGERRGLCVRSLRCVCVCVCWVMFDLPALQICRSGR